MKKESIIRKYVPIEKSKQMKPLLVAQLEHKQISSEYISNLHIHYRYQWYCVLRGEAYAYIGNKQYVLKQNMATLVAPNIPRRFQWKSGTMEYIYSIFENKSLILSNIDNRILSVPLEQVTNLVQLADEASGLNGHNSRILSEALLLTILSNISRQQDCHVKDQTLNKNYYREIVENLEYYMAQNLGKNITRQDLAQFASMSHQHLARIFKAVTGMTMKQRLTELRLQHAQDLLRFSNKQVTDIALDVGFQSFSHFTQLFKKKTGLSPSVFRSGL